MDDCEHLKYTQDLHIITYQLYKPFKNYKSLLILRDCPYALKGRIVRLSVYKIWHRFPGPQLSIFGTPLTGRVISKVRFVFRQSAEY